MKIHAGFLMISLPFIFIASLSGCRPSAPSDFRAPQEAFQKISRVSADWSAQTNLGTFQQTAELDCRHIVKDQTAGGIAAVTRITLGAPLAHQDTEYLFIDGKSYDRTTGQFSTDARPNWVRSLSNF